MTFTEFKDHISTLEYMQEMNIMKEFKFMSLLRHNKESSDSHCVQQDAAFII